MTPSKSGSIGIVCRRSTCGRALLGLVTGVLLAAGCSPDPGTADLSAPELVRFQSEQDFRDYLSRQLSQSRNSGIGILQGDFDLGAPIAQAAPGAGGGASDGGFSTTNLQEAGVGESDVVQTDGTHLFIADQQLLRIVRAFPAERMEQVGSLNVGAANELYLHGHIAVILGRTYRMAPQPGVAGSDLGQVAAVDVDIAPFFYSTPLTTVSLVDVSDPSAPDLLAAYELDGWLVSSRMIDATLHVVLGTGLDLDPLPEADAQTAPLEAVLPDVAVTTPAGSLRGELLGWSDIYHGSEPVSTQMTAVVSIEISERAAAFRSVGILARADTVYVSPAALYLANVIYPTFTFPALFPLDQAVSSGDSESTAVYKFDLGPEGARLVGSGQVPGHLLDRYALSEHQGSLRVATTVGQVSRAGLTGSTNNVYVLGLEGDRLNIVGRLEGLAPGEQIYSARFVGDRGFLVTFKKVDPLFTLDLSDPTDPLVVGELKVPGYSDYIHPLGPDHLLTIGKDAVDMGDFAWYQGVQLSLFDVSAFAEPQRLDVEIVGDRGTESEALYDTHAFNYYAPLGMLAVPMTIAQKPAGLVDPAQIGQPTFHGLCLYRVSVEQGITPAGHLSTASGGQLFYYGSGWTRGVFIGDHVYAVTSQSVQAAPLTDLTSTPLRLDLLPE